MAMTPHAPATPTRLPPPPSLLDHVDMQVQELIHGHRFVQDQEPYMIVLETLAVYDARAKQPGSAISGAHEDFGYSLSHRRALRFLVFQDRNLKNVIQDKTIPDDEKWARWRELANNQFAPDHEGHDAFEYLEERFANNLGDLYQAVRLIRSLKLDVMNKRRWSSQFLSITGPDLICPDMRVSGKRLQNWSMDRRFFGRGGELVYLMLHRSSLAKVLEYSCMNVFSTLMIP